MRRFPPGSMGVVVLKSGKRSVVFATRGSSLNNTLIYPGEQFDSIWKAQKFAAEMARQIAIVRQIPIKLLTQDETGNRVKGRTQIIHPHDEEISEDLLRFSLIMKE